MSARFCAKRCAPGSESTLYAKYKSFPRGCHPLSASFLLAKHIGQQKRHSLYVNDAPLTFMSSTQYSPSRLRRQPPPGGGQYATPLRHFDHYPPRGVLERGVRRIHAENAEFLMFFRALSVVSAFSAFYHPHPSVGVSSPLFKSPLSSSPRSESNLPLHALHVLHGQIYPNCRNVSGGILLIGVFTARSLSRFRGA